MNVLITGKGSYIGARVKAHLEANGHRADEADTLGDAWRGVDFAAYDAVIHVAAIVHQDAKSADEALFRRVNVELPVQIAQLAKRSGVGQFVFISTMAVYSRGKTLSASDSVIDADTQPDAACGYGGSKLQAEKLLRELEDASFSVAVVRPPNVYGPGCRGNYIPLFKKLALKLPVCPCAYTDVRQSMLYIDNLCELIRLIVVNRSCGVFLPQDDSAPNTVELISAIRAVYGRKTRCSKALGAVLKLFRSVSVVKKLYGGVRYDRALSDHFDYAYQIVAFDEGIKNTYS